MFDARLKQDRGLLVTENAFVCSAWLTITDKFDLETSEKLKP